MNILQWWQRKRDAPAYRAARAVRAYPDGVEAFWLASAFGSCLNEGRVFRDLERAEELGLVTRRAGRSLTYWYPVSLIETGGEDAARARRPEEWR